MIEGMQFVYNLSVLISATASNANREGELGIKQKMKKNYILIISGIIPLMFSIFVLNFFLKDDRKDLFESAKLLKKGTDTNFAVGELIKFSGFISEKNLKVKDEYVLAVKEKYVKGQNGRRSDWIKDEFYLQPIFIRIDDFAEIEVLVANDYLPCGDAVKISDFEPKKNRVLGLQAGISVSAVGRIINMNPIRVQTGHSLCSGTIENFKEYLNRKWFGYLLILLCIGVPSLGLIYLGLFKVSNEK